MQALQGPCLAGGAQAPPGLSSATMTSRPRIVAGGMISGLRPTSACRERLMTASSRAAAGATAGDGEGKLQSRCVVLGTAVPQTKPAQGAMYCPGLGATTGLHECLRIEQRAAAAGQQCSGLLWCGGVHAFCGCWHAAWLLCITTACTLACICRAPWRVVLPQWDCWRLLAGGWRMLVANLWALVIIYAARDALAFVLHRASQRLTNLGEQDHGRHGPMLVDNHHQSCLARNFPLDAGRATGCQPLSHGHHGCKCT